jgi:hypothetical protein
LIGSCEFHGFCVAVEEYFQVPLQREYTGRTWHFEYQVRVVGYHHELGDSWSAEDGMVGSLESATSNLMYSVPRMAWHGRSSPWFPRRYLAGPLILVE